MWVKGAIGAWSRAAGFSEGPVLRRVNRGDQVQVAGMSEKLSGNFSSNMRLLPTFPASPPTI
jgi:hypothetical protein